MAPTVLLKKVDASQGDSESRRAGARPFLFVRLSSEKAWLSLCTASTSQLRVVLDAKCSFSLCLRIHIRLHTRSGFALSPSLSRLIAAGLTARLLDPSSDMTIIFSARYRSLNCRLDRRASLSPRTRYRLRHCRQIVSNGP